MSTITLVGLLANTVIAPFAPAGTMAALALILPSEEFRVETEGCDCPAAHTERNPSGPKGTTVRFREYAAAFAGIPQGLEGIVKLRLLLAGIDGPPKGPLALRVSAIRHGVTGTKWSIENPELAVVNDQVAELVEPPAFSATTCQ